MEVWRGLVGISRRKAMDLESIRIHCPVRGFIKVRKEAAHIDNKLKVSKYTQDVLD